MTQEIQYFVYTGQIGENTEEMNEDYIKAVETKLKQEYPNASVDVVLKEGNSFRNEGYASGFEDDEDVFENCNVIAENIFGCAIY